MPIRTKQIEPIGDVALATDVKIGSLSALPVTLNRTSVTDALVSLYNALKTTFLSLNDTPASYGGHAHKFTKVSSGETGLVFSSVRENNAGNIGINFAGSMSTLDYRLLIDDSSPANWGGMLLNKNFGHAALEITAGGGAQALTITTDGIASDLIQCSGQYNNLFIVKHNGLVGIGAASPVNRLHVAWRSGDMVSSSYFGSSASGNNQVAIDAESFSAAAIRGNSVNGAYGMQGIASAAGSFGLYGLSATAGGVKGSGNTHGGWFESAAGTALYVHTGAVRFAPFAGTGSRMLIADATGVLGVQALPTTGITSLNTLSSSTQTFANDTNVIITSAGSVHTLGWSGLLPISRGGTGASTATAALTNLLPAQASSAGKFLTTDGTSASWAAVPPSGITSLNGLTGTAQTFTNETNIGISSSGSAHAFTWLGQLAIGRGGTGASTATAALTNLLPAQATNAGKFLTTDGTSASWAAVPPSGVTSLNGLAGAAQTFTNETNIGILSSGSAHAFTWLGQLAIERGGTGASTATVALTNLLPAQGGNNGKYLTTNGSVASWATVPTGITSLGGLTGASQSFTNDTNVTMFSFGTTHALTWAGQLAIGRGGTGASTATAALTNLLPAQASNAGKFLTTDGTLASWAAVPASGVTSLNGLAGAAQTFTNETNIGISSSGSAHAFTWSGLLAIGRGGTGASTATAALTNLLPAQASNAGKFLSTDGTSASWVAIPPSGITSLNGLTGSAQTFTNETNIGISSSGSAHAFTWSGQLAIGRGGTGASTATAALTNLLPAQATNAGKFLSTDGTSASWVAIPPSGITSLNGLTGSAQTFTNETNIGISSSGSAHAFTWLGQLAIGRGGTGASTATAALTNLLPAQASSAGKFLSTDGTSASWAAIPASGITSLNGLAGAAQTFTNETNIGILSSGSAHAFTWLGQLAIGRGGTGASTANTALNNLLPSQSSQAGKYLHTDGTNTAWKTFPTPNKTRFVSSGFLGLSAPYYTSIQDAIDAAESGDLVEIHAGTYNEHITLKDGVNLYTHSGVIIRYDGNTYHTIEATDVHCLVDGYGIFEHDAGTNLSVLGVFGTSNLTVRCKQVYNLEGGHAIDKRGTGTAIIYADEIFSANTGTVIDHIDGTLEIVARHIEQFDTTATLLYQAAGTLRISDALLKASHTSPTGTGGIINKSGGTMILCGCTIVNTAITAPTYSIGASSAQPVKVYHSVTNKPAHTNISFPVQSLVVDTDVS